MSVTSSEYIYGQHPVMHVLSQQPERVKVIYSLRQRPSRLEPIYSLARALGVSVQSMSKDKLDAWSEKGLHQGVVAHCSRLPAYTEAQFFKSLEQRERLEAFLILDGVQDPHNLGACLRTASAMGVNAVIVPQDRAAGMTPIVRKVASGAASLIPFLQVKNLARFMGVLKSNNVWLVGMDMSSDTALSSIDLSGDMAFVFGAEGSGLRHLTRDCCDYLAKIPMVGPIESLNVSVSVGMALYERQRQCNQTKR